MVEGDAINSEPTDLRDLGTLSDTCHATALMGLLLTKKEVAVNALLWNFFSSYSQPLIFLFLIFSACDLSHNLLFLLFSNFRVVL